MMDYASLTLTDDDIERVVRKFYVKVRGHPVLGPVFGKHISDSAQNWHDHELKIASFWKKALLKQSEYNGNPMMVHAAISEIKLSHFSVWLGMFDAVLLQEVSETDKVIWSRMAHRIGRGLSIGLERIKAAKELPPRVRP